MSNEPITMGAKAMRNKIFTSSENMMYISQMLRRNWNVYIYRKGFELIPTGVLWNIGAPIYILKPKQNEQ